MERLHIFLFVLLLFCSPWLSDGKTFFTHLNTPCTEDCKPDGGEYKCKTIDEDGRSQTMYCSPQENVDYWGRQCQTDSMCGKYGENYSWCKINIFSWGFCGLVKDDKNFSDAGDGNHITSRHRNKRAPPKKEINKKITQKITFVEEDASGGITHGNKKLKREAEELISSWDNKYLVKNARSELIKSTNLRIDMQGTFKRFNRIYHNLQVQINAQRGGKTKSTTLSQVNVPDGVPEQDIREGFLRSLNNQTRVFIDVVDIKSN